MMGNLAFDLQNRSHHRVPVEALCTELLGEELRHGLVVDLSPRGLRIQRPVTGRRPQSLQLEFEVPEIDEIVWARGEVRFDRIWQVPPRIAGGRPSVVRTTGIELVTLASRHQRLLRDYVMDASSRRADPVFGDWLMNATCYRRG